MNVELDKDVLAVASFMQSNIEADKLSAVAEALGKIAPLLWGKAFSSIDAIMIRAECPTSRCGQQMPQETT